MSVTASRLGHSPITVDWSQLGGASPGSLALGEGSLSSLKQAWQTLKTRFETGDVGFYNTPVDPSLSQVEESVRLAEEVLGRQQFTDCLFLGIGGSSLGPKTLLSALTERCRSGIRFHFMENPDPQDWKHTLQKLSPAKTLVCAVTKSGTTFETLAQLLLAMEWMGRERWKTHLVAITDPEKGDLRAFAKAEGVSTLSIAPSIGGRFSVFSPVGFFAAALAGLSVPDFVKGAKQVRDAMETAPMEKNPIFILANRFVSVAAKYPIHVCMPYSTRLRDFGDWYVQLWAESLGKDGKGFTPLAALGAVDQHSLLQILRDGPDDKITWFMTVDQVEDPVRVPVAPLLKGVNLPAFSDVARTTLQDLLRIEYQSIAKVMTRRTRPHLSFRVDQLDERGMGALMFAFSVLTGVTGTLWGINPFDQPGVEEGKGYIRQALAENKPQFI